MRCFSLAESIAWARTLLVGFVVVLGTTGALSGQGQTLPAPDRTLSHDFLRITGLVELPDGRVLISDADEPGFFLGDFRSGAVRLLGRLGEGPLEYRSAFGVVAAPGDTILGYDPRNGRFLKFAPNGTILSTIPYPLEARRGGVSSPRGVDAAGRVYWERAVIRVRGGDGPERDSRFQVVRWTPGTPRIDTVAVGQDHDPARSGRQRFHPLATRDAWCVARGGHVLLLRSQPFRLDRVEVGGAIERGPVLPFVGTPITKADRDAYRAAKALEPLSGMSGPTRPGESSPDRERVIAEGYPDASFPSVFPPFDPQGVHCAPTGGVWVEHLAPAQASERTVVMISQFGEIRTRFVLRGTAHLLAVGRSAIYLVRDDSEGFQHVDRVPMPSVRR